MTYRDTALSNAKTLAQQIFAEAYLSGRQAYYVERDGQLTRDEYVGNFHERQSVYFGGEGAAERILDTGLGSVGYNGAEEDYREMVPVAGTGLAEGDYHGQYDDEHEVYWIVGQGWSRPGEICRWQDRDVEHPSEPLVAAIEALPVGWFADEIVDA